MGDTTQSAEDVAILEQLNLDYNRADQASDAKRFSELLAEDFIVQTPGVTRNRDEYLEYIAKPRPFKDLTRQAHADTHHKMLDALDGLSAWLGEHFDPGNPQRIEEPSDPEVWRWIAVAFHAAATYE